MAHCVCVFLCVHVWGGSHNVSLVCLTHGSSQGSSPPGAPSTWGRPSLPTSVANHSQPGLEVWEAAPQFIRKLSLIASPHTARHMTSEGGGGCCAGSQNACSVRGHHGPHELWARLPTLWTLPYCSGGPAAS